MITTLFDNDAPLWGHRAAPPESSGERAAILPPHHRELPTKPSMQAVCSSAPSRAGRSTAQRAAELRDSTERALALRETALHELHHDRPVDRTRETSPERPRSGTLPSMQAVHEDRPTPVTCGFRLDQPGRYRSEIVPRARRAGGT